MSSNVFKGVCTALSALYNESPAIGVVGAPEGAADMLLESGGLIDTAGLWPIMQRVQLFTIGIREMFVRVDLNHEKTGLLFRPVTPDFVYASSPPGDPMTPNYLMEMRLRTTERGKHRWTYDVFDLTDMQNPKWQVRAITASGKLGADLSDYYLDGDYTGTAYPYRDQAGMPVLPYTLYHAQLMGDHLFDPFNGAELCAGSLTASMLHTYGIHICRDAAHPQRWVMGCGIDGANVYDQDGAARRVAIASDPSSILVFSADPELTSQPMIGQFNPGGDEARIMEFITQFERKLSQSAGINPASIQKISGDPRSGYAIAMSRSDTRSAQRRFTPSFKRGDLNTIRLAAIISNRFLGTQFPERSGNYRIEYSSIPLSKEEAESLRNDIIDKMNAGLITKIDAVKMLYPDFSDDQAAQYLREVKRQQIEFG
tara:strand:+ start:377 stop:1657 length:1281 start_codon:yes stop_codon:yes gene_type:complete